MCMGAVRARCRDGVMRGNHDSRLMKSRAWGAQTGCIMKSKSCAWGAQSDRVHHEVMRMGDSVR